MVPVKLASFEELQDHINNATGPTVLVLEATRLPLPAAHAVVVNRSDITIAASAAWATYSAARSRVSIGDPAAAPVRVPLVCSRTAGSLLQVVNARNTRILGLQLTGCSRSALQLQAAPTTLVRGCVFTANSNSSSGGAIDALQSQLWVDGCMFEANLADSGSGGAVFGSSSQLLVTSSRFANNAAGSSGGAVALRGRSPDAIATAAAFGLAGLGACWKDVDAVLDNVTLLSNRAKLQGGALASNGSYVVLQASSAATNKARYGGVAYMGQTARLNISAGSAMDNNTALSSGGVVYAVSPGARVVLADSSFSGNRAKILGGVVTAKEAAALRLEGSTFTNNTASLAAGVVYGRDADMAASGCRFDNNTAQRDGGALYCAGGCSWRIRSCTFTDNQCGANGGAIFGWNVDALVSSCSMQENSAGALGGAVSVANSTLELRSCKLGSNSAYGSDAAGGAVYSQGSRLNISDSLLAGNVASWGGGVYITNSTLEVKGGGITNSSVTGSGAAMYALRSTASLANATLSYNSAQQYGGSLYCSSSTCSLLGTDIVGDSASLGAGCIWAGHGSLSMKRCHVFGCLAAADDGGAVHATASSAVAIMGCSFKSCSAPKGSGGALWVSGVPSFVIRGSLLSANQVSSGAVMVRAAGRGGD